MKYERREKPRLEHEKSGRLTKRQRQERRVERRADRHRRRYTAKKTAMNEFFNQLTDEQYDGTNAVPEESDEF